MPAPILCPGHPGVGSIPAAWCRRSRRASPGLHIVTLHHWRAEKRICCAQDSGARPAGGEHGTGTASGGCVQAGRGERGHRAQRRHSNRDRSLPAAPAFGKLREPASKGLVTPKGWLCQWQGPATELGCITGDCGGQVDRPPFQENRAAPAAGPIQHPPCGHGCAGPHWPSPPPAVWLSPAAAPGSPAPRTGRGAALAAIGPGQPCVGPGRAGPAWAGCHPSLHQLAVVAVALIIA